MGLGALVLVAALLAPKVAHAVAAALMQVVNTPSASAVTSSIDTQGRIRYQSIGSLDLACVGKTSVTLLCGSGAYSRQ